MKRIRVALLALCLGSASAAAQVAAPPPAATGTISGIATDETGAAVADVRIIAINDATALRREVTTGAEGTFIVPQLPPGQYKLRAERDGFAAHDLSGILVNASEQVTVQVQLKVEAFSDAVVVTAQKRGQERLQDVPIPITVLDADRLAGTSVVWLKDYYSHIPGLNLAPNFLGQQRLSIRGVSTGGGSPTVGLVVDDLPYGGSSDITSGIYLPEIDPGDLASIEVLRGPQGTLYGANSMGGLIRYVTKDPSFNGFSGQVESGTNFVTNGADPGLNVRGSANVPINRVLAMRVSGFLRQDAGYVDNPIRHLDGVNKTKAGGGRATALWKPSDRVSFRVAAMFQHDVADGSAEVDPALGDLKQNFLPATKGYDRIVQVYSAALQAKVRGIDLTSITGYSINDHTATDDRTAQNGQVAQMVTGTSGVRYRITALTKKFSQELRAASTVGRRFDVLLGSFYTHENGPVHITMHAEDVATGQTGGQIYDFDRPATYDEYAGFGNVTTRLSERFDVQLGARLSRSTLRYSEVFTGALVPFLLNRPSPAINPELTSDGTSLTYLVTPRMRVARDWITYARFASGYRPGGSNPPSPLPNAPTQFEPDRTQNYEVGVKGAMLNETLSIDASAYVIDWTDIQFRYKDAASGLEYTTNGSRAKSQGVELTVTATPARGLQVGGWLSFNHAVLSDDFPTGSTLYGLEGDRLPYASRISGALSLEQTFTLTGRAQGFVGATVNSVGDRISLFQATPLRQRLPAYARLDVRGGINHERWGFQIYATNLTDERGVVNGGIGYVPANLFAYIQPRTVGLTVSRSF